MKKSSLVHTNGYDAVVLANGTFLQVDKEIMQDFLNAHKNNDDFSDWDGNELGTFEDFEDSEIAYYDNNNMLVITDNDTFEERLEYYGLI